MPMRESCFHIKISCFLRVSNKSKRLPGLTLVIPPLEPRTHSLPSQSTAACRLRVVRETGPCQPRFELYSLKDLRREESCIRNLAVFEGRVWLYMCIVDQN